MIVQRSIFSLLASALSLGSAGFIPLVAAECAHTNLARRAIAEALEAEQTRARRDLVACSRLADRSDRSECPKRFAGKVEDRARAMFASIPSEAREAQHSESPIRASIFPSLVGCISSVAAAEGGVTLPSKAEPHFLSSAALRTADGSEPEAGSNATFGEHSELGSVERGQA